MFRVLVFLLLIPICLLVACQPIDNLSPYPPPTNPNLRFFGYTLVDVAWDDPTDRSEKTNYVDEVASFTNMADILAYLPEESLLPRLEFMQQNGLKALIHLNEIFFEQVGTGGEFSGALYDLRTDFQARWDTFVAVNALHLHQNLVQAFYLGEEPTWNGISFAEMEAAANYIKQGFPNVPILLVEAYPALEELRVPTSVDWVGFDHYFIADPENDATFLSELATLKAKRSNNQAIVLIMDAHHLKFAHGSNGIGRRDMDLVARSYYNLANQDLDVIGLIGYHWPSGFDFKRAVGTRGLPKHVQDEHRRIGKAITGK